MKGNGVHFDTTQLGDSNFGHLYGTEFSTNEKREVGGVFEVSLSSQFPCVWN
jgi:hypothetical protein